MSGLPTLGVFDIPPRAPVDRAVILLHGLGRGPRVMRRLATALGDAGWAVCNVGYASLRRPLAFHADMFERGPEENKARDMNWLRNRIQEFPKFTPT